MPETFTRFDPADFLTTTEEIDYFLEAASEDNDPAVILLALGAVARARNMTKLARDTGLTRSALYKALGTGGNPSFDTVAKVVKALGLRVSITTAKATP